MFHLREERIQELADLIAAAMPPIKIELAAMEREPSPSRTPTRRYYLRRIRWLSESFGLAWMVDQVALGHRLDTLDDGELHALLADMERGWQCLSMGDSLADAGLVRMFE